MNVISINVQFNDCTRKINIKTQNKCPFCGAFNQPNHVRNTQILFGREYIICVVLVTACCGKHFLSGYLYQIADTATVVESVFSYPNTFAADLPERLAALSPRFADLFCQAYTAEQNKHYELAACGYRNALEVLIKDYAIEKLGKSKEEVTSKNLYKAIEAYMPNALLTNGANIIRVLGNDNTHYCKRFQQYDFDIMKKFSDAFIHTMDAHLLLLDYPEDLPS